MNDTTKLKWIKFEPTMLIDGITRPMLQVGIDGVEFIQGRVYGARVYYRGGRALIIPWHKIQLAEEDND